VRASAIFLNNRECNFEGRDFRCGRFLIDLLAS
jgi:hypothetical protein